MALSSLPPFFPSFLHSRLICPYLKWFNIPNHNRREVWTTISSSTCFKIILKFFNNRTMSYKYFNGKITFRWYLRWVKRQHAGVAGVSHLQNQNILEKQTISLNGVNSHNVHDGMPFNLWKIFEFCSQFNISSVVML